MAGTPSLGAEALGHLEQAQQNLQLYRQLRGDAQFLDWAITVLFYSALHLVQAYANEYGSWVPIDHKDRATFIREEKPIKGIYHDYQDLKDRSRDMRYDLWKPKPEEVDSWHDQQYGRIVNTLRRRGIDLTVPLVVQAPPSIDLPP